MKKILFVLPNVSGGGAERIAINLVKNLNREKLSPAFFLYYKEGEYLSEIPNNIPIYYAFDKKNHNKFDLIYIFFKLLQCAKNMDIVVGASEIMPTYLSVVVGRLLRIKTLGWVHIEIESSLNRMIRPKKNIHKLLLKLLYKLLDGIITVSHDANKSIKNYLPESKKFIAKTIYNPNDLSDIKSKANKVITLNIDSPMIIGIGRLDPQKKF